MTQTETIIPYDGAELINHEGITWRKPSNDARENGSDFDADYVFEHIVKTADDNDEIDGEADMYFVVNQLKNCHKAGKFLLSNGDEDGRFGAIAISDTKEKLFSWVAANKNACDYSKQAFPTITL